MINLEELMRFLIKAKLHTYARDGAEVPPERVERPGFKELEFSEGDWNYRDSYTGFYLAPGQEIVRFQRNPVWAMAYNGGMTAKHHGNKDFAKQTFRFLKEALQHVQAARPFRGPDHLQLGDYAYHDESTGTLTHFRGAETIFFCHEIVFVQDYIGGLILPKERLTASRA